MSSALLGVSASAKMTFLRPTASNTYHSVDVLRASNLRFRCTARSCSFLSRKTRSSTAANSKISRLKSPLVCPAGRGFIKEVQKMNEKGGIASNLQYELPLKIVEYPDPRLRAQNLRITSFDENLQVLVDEMFDVMYKTDGVGLSAPQVGVNVQLMVFNPAGERGKGDEVVLANPEIYKYSRKMETFEEGCLSFPNIYGDVERPVSVKIKAWDAKGKKYILSLKEFHARIFQHEYDHLQGILFFERMKPEVLDSIRPALKVLEQKYEINTGKQAPERI
eukprot:TRINITY_DN8213_c0_g1_i1.p1 TRINITY_DN8213_c0_g1~~TRINITY_DN8213_c0_g1_i1.p1  ORF type:complete len:278 (+),score=46.32 TRINITY_DN8213_c0_g1_i1:154-987(+)